MNLALQWYLSNDLIVNTNKTRLLILDSSNIKNESFKIKIGPDIIQQSPSLKYLGCTLDRNLKFHKHINLMCNKASKAINILKYVIKYIKSAKLFYSSYIRPIVESTPALLFAISKSDSDHIEKLQNRVLKIISGIKFNKKENCRLSDIREKFQLPLLSSRRELFFFIKAFNAINGLDNILNPLIPPFAVSSCNSILRSYNPLCPKFLVPKVNKTCYGGNSFGYLVSTNWNNFPTELRNCKDQNQFKRIAKNFFHHY